MVQYGGELVPAVNARFTVRDKALFQIGIIYKSTNNKKRATEIFEVLMGDAEDINHRNASRTHYLDVKQSHLKLNATGDGYGRKSDQRNGGF